MPELLDFDKSTGIYNLNGKNLITKILKNEYKDPSLAVVSVQSLLASKPGDNHMSQVQRIKVNATNAEGISINKSFIMKVEHHSPEKKQILNIDRVWANEEFVYESLFPNMEKVCNINLPRPKYYYGDDKIIIVEDLSEKGYRIGSRTQGLDLKHALLVMDKLAQFHASSLAYRNTDIKEFNRLINRFNHPYSTLENIRNSTPFIKSRIMQTIDLLKTIDYPEKYNFVFKYLEELADNQEKQLLPLEIPNQNGACVISHGDLWVNNILFSYDNVTGEPIDAKFVDYQCTRPGSIAKDVLYFSYLSVQPEVRSQNLDEILKHYHNKLTYYVKQFVNDTENFSFIDYDSFYDEFTRFRLFGLINAILSLPMMVFDNKESHFDIFTTKVFTNTSLLRDRLSSIIDEFINKGWIAVQTKN